MVRAVIWIYLILLAALTSLAAGVDAVRIDDFEDGDKEAAAGVGWIVIADDQVGGASSARIGMTAPGARGSKYAMRLEGTTAEGFPVPFAGAWVGINADGWARDISAFDGIRFRARGDGNSYRAGLRRTGVNFNFVHAFVAPKQWTLVEVPFDGLRPVPPSDPPPEWSPEDVGWIGFSSGSGSVGEFLLEIDDVELYSLADETAVAPADSKARRLGQIALSPLDALTGLEWRTLSTEEQGDATRPTLPDATSLRYAIDTGNDRVWFRVDLAQAPDEQWLGINIAIDADLDPDNGTNWWGTNQEFKFDRLVTAYLNESGGYWQGPLGIADAAGVADFNMNNLSHDVAVAVDRDSPALMVGVPRRSLDPDGRMRLIATVGSSFAANDDVPNTGAVELNLDR